MESVVPVLPLCLTYKLWHRNLTISSTESYILVANIDSAWVVYTVTSYSVADYCDSDEASSSTTTG